MEPGAIPIDVVRSYLHMWLSAVELQRDRLLNPTGSELGIDSAFFALALRNLYRAAEAAKRVSRSSQVFDALVAFDRTMPFAKDLRDVLEHFDYYSLGIGDLQHRQHPD